MNISKNILSLGLIAVISGISTAQTYTATAGTNGVTDIQSDYSMSTGDGASVSVDVPLEFELPKKVAIAVAPNGTKTMPALPEFDGIVPAYDTNNSMILDGRPYSGTDWRSIQTLESVGGIYSNTPITVTLDTTDFVHESDSNSIIKPYYILDIGKTVATVWDEVVAYGDRRDDSDHTTTAFPASISLDDTAITTEGGKFSFRMGTGAYIKTIDPTDRAGKYISVATLTVSTL